MSVVGVGVGDNSRASRIENSKGNVTKVKVKVAKAYKNAMQKQEKIGDLTVSIKVT